MSVTYEEDPTFDGPPTATITTGERQLFCSSLHERGLLGLGEDRMVGAGCCWKNDGLNSDPRLKHIQGDTATTDGKRRGNRWKFVSIGDGESCDNKRRVQRALGIEHGRVTCRAKRKQ